MGLPYSRAGAVAEQAWNEAALAEAVAAPRWQLWTYADAAVVLGYSQRALMESRSGRATLPLIQRRAGGGAVLTGPWMLSASVVLPPAHPLLASGTVSSYRWLGEIFVGLLQDLGIAARAIEPAELESGRGAPNPSWACFAGLSPWEVVADGRKIVGLAQLRRRTGVLLACGCLLYPPEWALLCEALDMPAEHAALLADQTASCAELLGHPVDMDDLAHALQHRLAAVLRADGPGA
ncbi:MAG: lipoate--protein ligase [Rhodocyclaceae bacterium]|nr:lipoate--protein ligase [Rhodocyclaceae bacterium]